MKREILIEKYQEMPVERFDIDIIKGADERVLTQQKRYPEKLGNTVIIVIEELSELMQEISKSIRKSEYGKLSMTEETADCLLSFFYFEELFGLEVHDLTSMQIPESMKGTQYPDIMKQLADGIIDFTNVLNDMSDNKTVTRIYDNVIPNLTGLIMLTAKYNDISIDEIKRMMMVKTDRVADALDTSQKIYHDDKHYEEFM